MFDKQYRVRDIHRLLGVSTPWVRKMENIFPNLLSERKNRTKGKPIYYNQKDYDVLCIIQTLRICKYSIEEIKSMLNLNLTNEFIVTRLEAISNLLLTYKEVAKRYQENRYNENKKGGNNE